VPEDQLGLALGTKNVNLRLAAKLVCWHIDVHEQLMT
jgi:transcription antitermination factor NusA-like protein